MNAEKKMLYLRGSLIIVGLIFSLALYPLMHFFPSSWGWTPPQPEYEVMILGVYFTLGIFLLIAARNPMEHKSLIWFTIYSSAVHASIMLFQAISDPLEYPNLYGDIPGLFLIAIMLAAFMPGKEEQS